MSLPAVIYGLSVLILTIMTKVVYFRENERVMGLFNFLDRKPDIEVLGIDFYGGEPGSLPDRFDSAVLLGSRALVARVHLSVNRAVEFKWRVVIMDPGSGRIQGKGVPEGYAMEFSGRLLRSEGTHVELPELGLLLDKEGSWPWALYDEDENILKTAFIHVWSREQMNELNILP